VGVEIVSILRLILSQAVEGLVCLYLSISPDFCFMKKLFEASSISTQLPQPNDMCNILIWTQTAKMVDRSIQDGQPSSNTWKTDRPTFSGCSPFQTTNRLNQSSQHF